MEFVEKERSSGGHANRAGVGDIEGEGDEPRVTGGELKRSVSSAIFFFFRKVLGREMMDKQALMTEQF